MSLEYVHEQLVKEGSTRHAEMIATILAERGQDISLQEGVVSITDPSIPLPTAPLA
jgi:hypothetical protein